MTQTTGANALRGGALRSVILLVPQILTLVLSVVAARILGPDLMGRQSFIAFVEMTAIVIGTMGLNISIMRTTAVGLGEGLTAQVRGLLAWAMGLATVSGIVVGSCVASISIWASHDQVAWILAGYTTAAGTIQTIPQAFLNGLQKWAQAMMAGLCTGGASVLAAVIVLFHGGGITGLFAVEAVTMSANVVWTGALAWRAMTSVAPVTSAPGDLRRRALMFALPTALIAILDLVVWKRSEFLFLAHFSTSNEVAQYSIAFGAVAAASVVPVALTTLISSVANLHGSGATERIRSGFARAVRLLLTVTIPITAGIVALGPVMITTVYGQSYATAGRVLQVLIVFFPLIGLQYLCDAFLAGTGKRRVRVLAVAAGAVVDLVLCVLLIPANGALGAAVSNGCAQVIATTPIIVSACRNHRFDRGRLHGSLLARTLASALLAGISSYWVVWLASDHFRPFLGLMCGIFAGLTAWIVLARWLRVLTYDDGEWVIAALPRRVHVIGAKCVRAVSRDRVPTHPPPGP
jgi:O-antigen/teichoic acid export membrane protein